MNECLLLRRMRILCVCASVLLLLSVATVAVTSPLPLQAIGRTQIMPTVKAPITVADSHQIEGVIVHFEDFAITDDEDTTAAMYLGGLIPWRVINESGAAATLTMYDARSLNSTALTPVDQDGVAVAAFGIADDESHELPTALAGCTVLVIKGAVAADGFTLVCKR